MWELFLSCCSISYLDNIPICEFTIICWATTCFTNPKAMIVLVQKCGPFSRKMYIIMSSVVAGKTFKAQIHITEFYWQIVLMKPKKFMPYLFVGKYCPGDSLPKPPLKHLFPKGMWMCIQRGVPGPYFGEEYSIVRLFVTPIWHFYAE